MNERIIGVVESFHSAAHKKQLEETARRLGFTLRWFADDAEALQGVADCEILYSHSQPQVLQAARELYDRGVYVNPVLPPATPADACLLRTSYMATHTHAQLDEAMDVIGEVLGVTA